MEGLIRQGDVLLLPVTSIPESAKYVRRSRDKNGRSNGIILAAGEATGHHHRIRERGARMYTVSGRRFLRTTASTVTLTHEEHDPLTIPPNTMYEVVGQREYVPQAPARRVYD